MPKWSDRTKLPYTEAVVMELLRLRSPLALGVPHRTFAETTLGEYTIPEDTHIFTDIRGIHMNEEYFADPERLDPSRHLDANGKFVAHPKVKKNDACDLEPCFPLVFRAFQNLNL